MCVGARFIAPVGVGWSGPCREVDRIRSHPQDVLDESALYNISSRLHVRIYLSKFIIAPVGWGGANVAEFANSISWRKSRLISLAPLPLLF